MTAARLVARTHPFETRVLLVVGAAALGVALAAILRLWSFGVPLACFGDGISTDACRGYERAVFDYFEFLPWARVGTALLLLLTVVPGALFGLALLAKELDRGTAAFVWSLTTSRRRWLVARIVPVAVVLALTTLAAGALADQIVGLADPLSDPQRSFEMFGLRGLALPAIALAVFGFALLAGAAFGRVLPAMIAALLLALAAYAGVNVVSDRLLGAETVEIDPFGESPVLRGQPRYVDTRVRTPEGELIGYEEAYNRYGERLVVGLAPGEEPPPGSIALSMVTLVNPVEVYAPAAARLAVLYAALALSSIVVAVAVIDRRRP